MRMQRFIAVCIAGLFCFSGCSQEKQLGVEKAESFPNGAKKKENYFYKIGMKKDIVRTVYYFQNGAMQSDAYFKAGKPDSLATIYYQSGKKYKETKYNNGAKSGKEMSWYENGQVKSEANYVDGSPEGIATTYFENGAKQSESVFKGGKKDGIQTTWFPNGNKRHVINYTADSHNGLEQEFFENGKLKLEQNWASDI